MDSFDHAFVLAEHLWCRASAARRHLDGTVLTRSMCNDETVAACRSVPGLCALSPPSLASTLVRRVRRRCIGHHTLYGRQLVPSPIPSAPGCTRVLRGHVQWNRVARGRDATAHHIALCRRCRGLLLTPPPDRAASRSSASAWPSTRAAAWLAAPPPRAVRVVGVLCQRVVGLQPSHPAVHPLCHKQAHAFPVVHAHIIYHQNAIPLP